VTIIFALKQAHLPEDILICWTEKVEEVSNGQFKIFEWTEKMRKKITCQKEKKPSTNFNCSSLKPTL